LYGFDYAELISAGETLTQLKRTREEIEYSCQDRADLKNARYILNRSKTIATFYDPNQLRDAHGRWTGGGTLDGQKAVAHLVTKAKDFPPKRGEGQCATKVREAIEAGGIDIAKKDWRNSAKDYGDTLQKYGFDAEVKVGAHQGFPPKKKYTPQAGDVVVIQGTSTSPHGHMAMYSGKQWISDFKQRTFWPGREYSAEEPSYVIYRHKNP
jgi:hypothetical protein